MTLTAVTSQVLFKKLALDPRLDCKVGARYIEMIGRSVACMGNPVQRTIVEMSLAHLCNTERRLVPLGFSI